MKHTILRGAAVAASAVALAVGTVVPAQAGGALVEKRAVQWLEDQVPDGVAYAAYDGGDGPVTYAAYGPSIDVALAFDALGRKRPVARTIRDQIASEVENYVGYDPEQYAGATAKMLTLVTTTGGDPTDVGGLDLVARLEGLTSGNGPTRGRITDQSEYGDYANTLGQSFAARGLSAVGSPLAWPATQFLLDQQCEDGWFRASFADAEATDQTCDGDAASAPSIDTTATAVLALATIEGHRKKVGDALDAAKGWLASVQGADGSFSSTDEGANTNTTGLAGWALGELGACGKARKAARWVLDLQVGKAQDGTALEDQKGAIAYDAAALADGEDNGIDDLNRIQWTLATAQAGPAIDNRTKAACKK